MTEEDLQGIEDRLDETGKDGTHVYELLSEDVPDLIAEVRQAWTSISGLHKQVRTLWDESNVANHPF